jgi:hypothetical protein
MGQWTSGISRPIRVSGLDMIESSRSSAKDKVTNSLTESGELVKAEVSGLVIDMDLTWGVEEQYSRHRFSH